MEADACRTHQRPRGKHFGQIRHSRQRGDFTPSDQVLDKADGVKERPPPGFRGRPPHGLSGREIGMWYARRSREKKEAIESINRPTVSIDGRQESSIRHLLASIDQLEHGAVRCSHTPSNMDHAAQSKHAAGALADRPGHRACPTYRPPERRRVSVVHGVCPRSNVSLFGEDKFGITVLRDAGSAGADVTCDGEDNAVAAPTANAHGAVDRMSDVEDDSDECSIPQIAGLVEYSRAHTDTVYHDNEDAGAVHSFNQSALDEVSCRALDDSLRREAEDLASNGEYQRMLRFRHQLPSHAMRQELVAMVQANQVLVVSGETGCGKTTQVPQYILDDHIVNGMGSRCNIICTQPRRISAVSVAERVAAERCCPCGGDSSSVGYQIRLETRRPRCYGSMLFCTTGIVFKLLEGNQHLTGTTHIILDEIHERDLHSDFLMIILKDLLPRRPDLKVILMSATLKAELFSKYFGDCQTVKISGFMYPVREFLLEDVLEETRYHPKENRHLKPRPRFPRRKWQKKEDEEEIRHFEAWLRKLAEKYSQSTVDTLRQFDDTKIDLDLVVTLINHIITGMEDGAILVFLPGWTEINDLNRLLLPITASLRVIPLHSLMPTVNQREVFIRPPQGIRKIVLATNIAETSVTIDDVVFVIDCGRIKVTDYDPSSNLTRLEPRWVSKANANQRRGRAGRVQPGYCYHLFTSFQLERMEDELPPEMLRTRLEELCLQIKLLKLGEIESIVGKAMQAPSPEAVMKAISSLKEMNALDEHERLLPLGMHLARIPVEPHMGKLILFGAMFCCLDPILTVAASLTFKDGFTCPLGKEVEVDQVRKELSGGHLSDHLVLVNAFKGWEGSVSRGCSQQYCWENFLSEKTLKMLRAMKRQLCGLLFDLHFVTSADPKHFSSNVHSDNVTLVRAVLCAGLYPNVAKVRKHPRPGDPPYRTVSLELKAHKAATVHPKSIVCRLNHFPSKWFVFHQIMKTTQVFVHDCTMIYPYALLFFGGRIDRVKDDNGQDCVSVDGWIMFKASRRTAQLVKDLRHQLDRLLWQKITHPGPTDWNTGNREGAVMSAITDLLSTEQVEERSVCS